MQAKWILAALCAAAVMACGKPANEGQVAMEVGVSGLTAEQNFCFTWKLYQPDEEGAWKLVDQMAEPTCADRGVDLANAFGTCYGDRRFLIAYEVTFLNGETVLGVASGTSGGGEKDVCIKNFDVSSNALFQFGNEGNVGGVNPGVEIDQVCANDKYQWENGELVSALWMQGDSCSGTPDTFCSIGEDYAGSETLRTLRVGVTEDGLTRFIFNVSASTANYYSYMLAFEPIVAANKLVLQHNPFILAHNQFGASVAHGRVDVPAIVYRYDAATTNLGFVYWYPGSAWFGELRDGDASCNGAVDLDSVFAFHEIGCVASRMLGAVPAGGSAFELIFRCEDSSLAFVGCDAQLGCVSDVVTANAIADYSRLMP